MSRLALMLAALLACPLHADELLRLRATTTDGPGVARTLELDGGEVLLEQAHAEEGGPVGTFRAAITSAELEALGRAVRGLHGTGGPPDGPSLRLMLEGRGAPPPIVIALPAADPAGAALSARLDALATRALAQPVAAVTFAAEPLGAARRGALLRIRVRVANVAKAPLRVSFAGPAHIEWVGPPPAPRSGVTPLPPEWAPLTTLALPSQAITLAPGASWTVTIAARPPGYPLGGVRVVYEGPLALGSGDAIRRFAVSTASAPAIVR